MNIGSEPVRGTVTTSAEQPRSNVVSTPSGDVRRNQSQLIVPPTDTSESTQDLSLEAPPTAPCSPKIIQTRSRTGTEIVTPNYLRYSHF